MSKPCVHGARVVPPWLRVPAPVSCACANFDRHCKPFVARSVLYIPTAVLEDIEDDDERGYRPLPGRPNMGIRAQVKKQGYSDYDSIMYHSWTETPMYEKYLDLDEFENLCVSQPPSPSRCELFCRVPTLCVCYLTSLSFIYLRPGLLSIFCLSDIKYRFSD